MTEQSPEPVSLERARLLLGWLRAQRTVDVCLSELLAAGPAGERRVSREIDRVTGLVSEAAAAFDAYRECVRAGRDDPGDLAIVTDLHSVTAGAVGTVETAAPLNR